MNHQTVLRCLFVSALAACANCGTSLSPDVANDQVKSGGYQLQRLSMVFAASFVRDNRVFLLRDTGEVVQLDDGDLTATPVSLGFPFHSWGRCLFVSRAGAIFASGDHRPLFRSVDGGATYTASLNAPVWRMDEDDQGSLYAGNYTKDAAHVATLYKSADGGDTWSIVFSDPANNHIHTVRWDDRTKRLYIAFGDGSSRGQAYSDDRGNSWNILAAGPDQGHTDVALTRDSIVWATDDQSGRVLSIDKRSGRSETISDSSQFMWFAVANDLQVFIGTAVSRPGQHAGLLASNDEGQSWQKVFQSSEVATRAYSDGLIAESRQLSSNGWLYFTKAGQTLQSYRIRRTPGQ